MFSYFANICLRKVVDSKILCLFTLVFKACNVCNFSPCVFYQHNFIFHDLQKNKCPLFFYSLAFLKKLYSLPIVSIYSAGQYLSDQPPSVFPSVTFYSCDCELLADNYVAFK